MRVAISGSSGLIGSALKLFLENQGCTVMALTRAASNGLIDTTHLDDADVVINLAGETIFSLRWTENKKRRVRESRIETTKRLVEAMSKLKRRPQVLVNASAIGYYGDRGPELLTESSAEGKGFLASVCRDWEAAAIVAEAFGVRVVTCRFGVVLSPKGGALATMLWPFKLGVGGIIGDGKQWMSWVAIDDLVSAIWHIIQERAISGPVNVVSPYCVTNREFTKTLGQVLHRPTIFPLPACVARWILGQMAEELILASTRVVPQVLLQSEFIFSLPELEKALRSSIR